MKHSIHLKNALLNKAWITLLIAFSSQLYAQPQLSGWALPPAYVKFTGTSPVVTGLPQTVYSGGGGTQASMHDALGNLLFFIVDGGIYDKDGYDIDFLKINGIETYGSNEISIVPVPGSCTRFYIISGYSEPVGLGERAYPVYAVLDLSLQSVAYPNDPARKGALQYFSGSYPQGTNCYDLSLISPPEAYPVYALHNRFYFGLATTPFRPATNDYFLFVKAKTFIWRYTIDANGISFDPANNPFSVPNGVDGNNNTHATEVEVIRNPAGNYQLAYVYSDFDICYPEVSYTDGALISNNFKELPANSLFAPAVVGLEFSPNGRYLYFTHTKAAISTYDIPVHYFDVTTGSTPIPLPDASYNGTDLLETSYIEMAHDGKMYFNNRTYLSSLADPNNGASVANWTNIAINVSTGRDYLPDQMDGNDYSSQFSSTMFCCLNNKEYNISSYTANTTNGFSTSATQTWTPTSNPFIALYNAAHPTATVSSLSTITVSNELVIPAGFNITITGMRFEYKPRSTEVLPSGNVIHYGARALVKNNTSSGGRLTLNNTTFTSYDQCGAGMWEGIEVWGNSAQIQNNSQGRVTMNAGCVISNAYCGIYAGKKNASYEVNASPLAGSTGAIISTTGGMFKNNYIDVDLFPYSVASCGSSFRNTAFITDAHLNPGIDGVTAPYAHVQLTSLRDVQFKTCTFKNAVPSIYPVIGNAGTGIYAYDAQFFCTAAITGLGSRFENLSYGINASALTMKTVTVDHCTFKNNLRGVYFGSITTATLTNNKYFIYELALGAHSPAAYGVYLDYCTGFKVTENNFHYNSFDETTNAPVNGTFAAYGCIVNQSHPDRRICHSPSGYNGDMIYKNNFREIYVATQAQGANSERNVGSTVPGNPDNFNPCYSLGAIQNATPNNIGLTYSCNDYLGVDKYNIRVTDYSLNNVSGNIAFQQGTTLTPAGNRFSHDTWYTTSTQNEIFMDASYSTSDPNNILYTYHGGNVAIDRTQPNFYTPYTNYLNPTGATTVGVNMSLAANSCLSRANLGTVDVSKQQIREAQTSIEEKMLLLDRGNAQEILDLVAIGNTELIKKTLLEKSPYLSDRVLLAAINRNLPPKHLQEIIVANSPVTEPVKNALLAISMPIGIRNQINAAQTVISGRKVVEDIITDNTNKKGYYFNEIIRYYLNDTINPNGLDSVIQTVRNFDVQDNVCTITKAFLAKGDVLHAQETVNNANAGGICNHLNTLITIEQQQDKIHSLKRDANIRQQVESIANDKEDKMSAGAESVLKFIVNNPFDEWIEPLAENRRMIPVINEESSKGINDVSEISIYPNPAQNILNINYELPNDATQATVNTYDYTGKLIDSRMVYGNTGFATFSVENLPNGIYMYSVVVNNSVISSQRIAITK